MIQNNLNKPQNNFRVESDSIGSRSIPYDSYYGIHSLRALENFPMTGERMHPEMIRSLALIKKACCIANYNTGTLDQDRFTAINSACDEILHGGFTDQFIVDAIQGGAGTSMNMNANEVIANIAIEKLGGEKGDYDIVHPNDHVNAEQSTNDVIPTAGKLTVISLLKKLYQELSSLITALDDKASQFDSIIKMGRTQLEDAVPIRLGQEFSAYASAVKRCVERIRRNESEMHYINMGGTAIGTGINTNINYYDQIASVLSNVSGEKFYQAENLIDSTQNIDSFAAISNCVKDCALVLSKIANDIRLMGSGPKTGFGELKLPPKQNGSSIMPGKINPVIPEVINQVAFRIVGNDLTISMAVEGGQLELNAFEPVVFYSLFQSIDLLSNAANTFRINCIEGLQADEKRCLDLLEASTAVVTALSPYIGYQTAADIAKLSAKTGIGVKEIIKEKHLIDEDILEKILEPTRMTKPGTLSSGRGQ